MGLNVLPLGIGLGGCRFAETLSYKSIGVKTKVAPMFINISSDELGAFKKTNGFESIQIGKSDGGAGKSRAFAIEIFTEKFDYEGLLETIKKRIISENIDIVTVSFSTGGGSGSGIAPLLIRMLTQCLEIDKVIDKEVRVIGIALLPAFNEGIAVFRNTLLAINDINKGIKSGNRYMLVKNSGADGGSFTEKCEHVNVSAATLISTYFGGTAQISKSGVLDLNDRRMGLSFSGLHSISKLKECEVSKSPFITPNSTICKTMLCEIPEENADMYESKVSSGVNLDFKYGYTSHSEGVVAHHGFNNIKKETVPYRKRFDDLKALDIEGDVDTGDDSLESLKSDVFHYSIRKNNSSVDVDDVLNGSDDIKDSMKSIVESFKDFTV